jgi:hypothetical protein
MRKFFLLGLVFLGAGVLSNCSGKSGAPDDDGCRPGSERCECRTNDPCDSGLICRSGLCVADAGNTGGGGGEPGCGSGETSCDGACVRLASDERHCGDCDTECTSGSSCSGGACECNAGRSLCDAACVDIQADATNCGACGSVCPEGEVCSDGVCSDSCADGLTQCGQSCVDLQSSGDHCGLCDNRCGANLVCEGGACACPGAETACDGVCVDTQENPQHCGACGAVCPGAATCVEGECQGGGTGGSGGGAGTGGNGGMSGSGGSAGASGGGGSGGSAGSAGSGTGGTPVVLLLIDGSSSMFEPRTSYWDPAYEALMDPTDGALTTYAERIRFGLAVYQGGTTPTTEPNPACSTISASGIALDNRTAIETVYAGVGDAYEVGDKYETPTGHAVNRVTTTLLAYEADPPPPKYIVLVTDGNPNTCATLDPQCGQDIAIKAVQDARAAGIRTLVLGMGAILTVDSGCPTYANCGEEHLQDLANAGLGLGVGAPKDGYQYETCVTAEGGLQASYGDGGNATYYSGTTMTELRAAMVDIFERIATGSVP